ncbi:hypothetical protein BS47DRAFT_1467771, partial [Hydnum rufescens UP504]
MAQMLDNLKEKLLDALFQIQSICCQSTARIKVNGRTFQIIKILGEGGFSFVYLAQDADSGRQFALKKIRCPTGREGVKEAMREVEAYRRFRHPNIIRILDSAVVQDRDGEGQIVYLFLPFYRRGNLQDVMNSNSVNGTHFPEREILRLFRGTCLAVRAMHTYRSSKASSSPNRPTRTIAPPSRGPLPHLHDDNDGGHDAHPHPDDEGEGEGFTYAGSNILLSTRTRKMETRPADVIFEHDELVPAEAPLVEGELIPFAHRDLKPANVMIDDNDEPILMDLGSAMRARVRIDTRQQALIQQDIAAEQSSMPYRAPELFDVKTGTILDEKVDIWSLGCTLFALAYGHSPFENTQDDGTGGIHRHGSPQRTVQTPYWITVFGGITKLIDMALTVDPKERPDIQRV